MRTRKGRWWLTGGLALVVAGLVACDGGAGGLPVVAGDALGDAVADVGGDTTEAPDVAVGPDAAADTGQPGEVPAVLRAARWRAHWQDDLAPYWTMPAALGTPEGNYPTFRGMDGSVRGGSERRPRMLSRQIYAYSMGYALTGDETLLRHARAGVDWLLAHARDTERGGWYQLLDANGQPQGEGPKLAQDASYCLLGLAAYWFVTRDAEVLLAILETRDLLFDPSRYFDAVNGRIRDGLTFDLSAEVDAENDGGWELVAQLDPINAFLLLVQPVVEDADRRAALLEDLRTLSEALVTHFHEDGIFWGVHNRKGQFGTRHVDFGHTLKAWWMLRAVDQRLDDHPFASLVEAEAPAMIERAFDAEYGRWAKRPTGAATVEYGSDWWAYAEADQIAATFNLADGRYTARLAETAGHWLDDYVDRTRTAREVVPSIARDGAWVWGWTDGDTAKCNEWKNGYHSTEHAVVLATTGAALEGTPATLWFAVEDGVDTFRARPYFFDGRETGREDTGTVTVGDRTLHEVKVTFTDLR